MSDRAILARLGKLEAESAIRRVVARYFQICDRLGPDTPFAELGDLFARDALWEGKGRYKDALGRHEGRDAVVQMIRSYCLPAPHFSMTAHFFSAEDILVGTGVATGKWMMLQTTTYADGKADLRSACLTMEFVEDGDAWRIAHFLTENIFSRRVDHWNDVETIPVPETQASGGNQ